ncbi:MAG TPA: TetR/AcrR family transcriptional regulator [bacterium]|nr:TetR/AcrR family transcriptional regulator [bacterium]
MPGLREIKKGRRERRILDAAGALFEERGFTPVSMEEIAARAEVGVGTLYNYFSSKKALLLSIISRDTGIALESAQRIIDSPPDGYVDAMTEMLYVYFESFFSRYPKKLMREIMAAFFSSMAEFGPELMEQDMRMISQIALLVDVFQRNGLVGGDVPAQDAAFAVYSVLMVQSMVYISLETMTLGQLKESLRRQLSLQYEGLRRRG